MIVLLQILLKQDGFGHSQIDRIGEEVEVIADTVIAGLNLEVDDGEVVRSR